VVIYKIIPLNLWRYVDSIRDVIKYLVLRLMEMIQNSDEVAVRRLVGIFGVLARDSRY
jgi:hypothetical protein